MIIAADIHLREESEQTVLNDVLPGLYKAVLADPQMILAILGDFWHIRYRVSVRLQNVVAAWLQDIGTAGGRVFFLPGNHDQISVIGENALEVFESMDHVKVFTNPERNEFGAWLPYRKRPEDTAEILRSWALPLGSVIWAHIGARGAWMNNAIQDTDGIDPVLLAGHRVISGHYHRRQASGAVTYIGSPYQTKADEAGQVKGYATWEPLSSILTAVDTQWGPRYHNLTVGPDGKMDLTGVRPGDEVRALAPSGVDLGALGRELERAGIRSAITPSTEAREGRLAVGAGATLGQYVEAYINQFAGRLDPVKLKSIFAEIVTAEGAVND